MFLTQVNDLGMGRCSHLVVLFLFGRRSPFPMNFLVRVRLIFLGYVEMFSISLSPPGLHTLITVSNVSVSKQDTQHWAREERGWWHQQAEEPVMKTRKMMAIEIEIFSIFYFFFILISSILHWCVYTNTRYIYSERYY